MQKSGNKLLVYFLYILPLILTIIVIVFLLRKDDELTKLQARYDSAVKKYESENDELKKQLTDLNLLTRNTNQSLNENQTLSDWAIEKFKAKGLSDPVRDIISDLLKHPQLIPYEGILGGTMRFYENESRILNNKWVYAYFEDGHYSGYMLLEYDVTDNGKISWEKIAVMKN